MQAASIAPPRKLLRMMFSILILCFCLPLLTSCEGKKTIVYGLDEKEANEIIVFLSSKGINATKVKAVEAGGGAAKAATFDITVSDDIATDAMSLLNQAGLPRRRGQNLLNIFSAGGLVPSELQEKIRYEAGIAEQIASTIRKIDGILDADVQISFPQEDPLNPGQRRGKITASVYVKHSGVLDDPNSHLMTKIKRLVAASVAGLNYDDVTVIPERSRFSDFQFGGPGLAEEEKQYVSVWSIIVAKDSVTRFRIVFFSFTLAILALILALVWVIWKIYPLLARHGGLKELLHLAPIGAKKAPTTEEKKLETTDKKEPKTQSDQGQIDKDIDET